MPEELRYLFVYGTLKRGFCRHESLQRAEFVGEVRTLPRYRLLKVADYPGLIEAPEGGRAIEGELWKVSEKDLDHLDEVEGVDSGLYLRRLVELEAPAPTPVEAYLYQMSTDGCPDCGVRWT